MLFSDINILDSDYQVRPHMYVGTAKDRIAYIGEQPPQQDYGERYDGAHKFLFSGFYNAHGHTPMTLLRGYGEDLNLSDWLYTKIFPFEDLLNDEDIYYSTLLGIAEMLQYGTVSVTDMYGHGQQMAEAFLSSGMKCNLGLGTTAGVDQGFYEQPRYQEYQRLFADYHQAANGRLAVDT